jgi:hypothetical protein
MTDPCEASKEDREGLPPEELGTTGRYKVTLKLTETQQGLDILRKIGIVPTHIFEGTGENVSAAQLNDKEATIYFASQGIVILGGDVSPQQLEQIRAAVEANTAVVSVAPEFTAKALSFP